MRRLNLVATPQVQSVSLNMFVSVASRFGTVCLVDPLVAWVKRDGCVTQAQLNDLLEPRRFDIEYRYSYALTYVLCALLYCGALPVLLPFAAVYFWSSYVADRYLVMRRYAKPPASAGRAAIFARRSFKRTLRAVRRCKDDRRRSSSPAALFARRCCAFCREDAASG